MPTVLVLDGQGGGVGRALCEQIKQRAPRVRLIALGTNVMATSAMLRAGADSAATGENAIRVNCARADYILGPIGVLAANSMLGELTPAMAEAVGASAALKILVPVARCGIRVAGAEDAPLSEAVASAVTLLMKEMGEETA